MFGGQFPFASQRLSRKSPIGHCEGALHAQVRAESGQERVIADTNPLQIALVAPARAP